MSENKTRPEEGRPADFLHGIADEKRRADSLALAKLMHEVTGEEAVLWGTSIVGFGSQHYKYDSGREGDTAIVSFAPRRNALVLYGVALHDEDGSLRAQLGRYEMGKGCLYIKDLSAINTDVLGRMIALAFSAKAGS